MASRTIQSSGVEGYGGGNWFLRVRVCEGGIICDLFGFVMMHEGTN